jgi:hypothetical protein
MSRAPYWRLGRPSRPVVWSDAEDGPMVLFYLILGLLAAGILAALILAIVVSFARERAAALRPETPRPASSPRPRRSSHFKSRAAHGGATQLMQSRPRTDDPFRRS